MLGKKKSVSSTSGSGARSSSSSNSLVGSSSSRNVGPTVKAVPSGAGAIRDMNIIFIGGQHVAKRTILRSFIQRAAPDHPEYFTPLTVSYKHKEAIYKMKFYEVDIIRNTDGTFEPITWKPHFDKVELVIYVADATKYPDSKELANDLTIFEYMLSTGYFYDKTNTYANLPLMVMFDRGIQPPAELEDRVPEIVQEYKKKHGAEDSEIFFHFTSLEDSENISSIAHALEGIITKADVTDLLTLTFNPHKKQNVKTLQKEKATRFNRMNPDLIEGRVAVEKLTPKAAATFIKILTSGYMITELNLRNNALKKQTVQELCLALQYNKTLTTLNLAHNQLGDENMPLFVEMLNKNATLQTLILLRNDITDVGATALASALSKNNTLRYLDLSDNAIKHAGTLALVNQLQSNQTLTTLSLWLNKLGVEGNLAIAELLRWNYTLTELNIAEVDANETDVQSWVLSLKSCSQSSLLSLFYTVTSKDLDTQLRGILQAVKQRKARKTLEKPVAEQISYDLSGGKLSSIPTDWVPLIGQGAELDLSNNEFVTLPSQILPFESLRALHLSRNNISGRLTNQIDRLYNLTTLDFSNNLLTSIPPEISALTNLEVLDLRWNRITSNGLPSTLFSMNLVHLKLQNNQLTSISEEIFKMTRLTNFLLNGNLIPVIRQQIIYSWSCRNKILDLSSMELTALPREISYCTALENLDLHNNKLVSIPPEIGDLTRLQFLNLADNQLDTLPWTLGTVKSLNRLLITNNPLAKLPGDFQNKDTNYVKTYIQSFKEGNVPCNRMKLMLVGQENVGKTSLSRCLKEMTAKGLKKVSKKAPTTLSTDGIDIDEWEPNDAETENNPDARLRFNIWDFGGQEVYYNTHQFFLSKRSLFLICFNLVDGEEMPRVEYWLQSINSRTPDAPVILVGTHLDSSKCNKKFLVDLDKYVTAKFKKRFPQLKNFLQVSCKTKKNLDILQAEILKIAKSQKMQDYPRSFLQLEDIVVAERSLHLPPIITLKDFKKMAVASNIPEENAQTVAEFLNDLGALIYYNDSRSGLDDLLILDPQWLTSLLATLITTKKNFVKNGILNYSDLQHVWHPPRFPGYLHERIVLIFEHFGVSHRMGTGKDVKILIPCLLEPGKPSDWDPTWNNMAKTCSKVFERRFRFPFLPLGFFSRVMSGVLEFTNPKTFYKNGIIATTRNKEMLLIEYDPSKIELIMRVCGVNTPVNLIRMLVDSLYGLINGWYSVRYQEFVIYQGIEIPLKDLESELAAGQSYYNCTSKKQQIPIDDLAPDLTLADFEEYMIDQSKLIMKQELGRGSFGFVSLAEYNGKAVAVKTLVLPPLQNVTEILRDFRRELWIGSSFKHENIVSMIGCSTTPNFCLVMEYVPFGNVYEYLRAPKISIGWPMRMKILRDVAAGMNFLHSMEPKMMHRDLKTPNILLVSLDSTSEIVAKLTDFGETRGVLVKMKGRGALVNPSWLAPEIMKDDIYTEKADVFSFGIVMWEVYRRQHPYAEYPVSYSRYTYQFEDAILKGLRPSYPPECPESYAKLSAECWATNTEERPGFDVIIPKLKAIKKETAKNTAVVDYDAELFAAARIEGTATSVRRSTQAKQAAEKAAAEKAAAEKAAAGASSPSSSSSSPTTPAAPASPASAKS